MQTIGQNITEIFHHLLEGETGDANEPMTEDKAQVWPSSLWAYLTSLFRK